MRKAMVVLSLVMVLGLALSASAATLDVPASYPTIQAAIDAAAWGDTVLVAPGEYVQSINLTPGVILQSVKGPTETTIRGDGSFWGWGGSRWNTYTILMQNGSVLSGFTIAGSYTGVVAYGMNTAIRNNIITKNDNGIYVRNEGSAEIINNIIAKNGTGIFNYQRSTSSIINNTLADNFVGIDSYSFSVSVIANNIVAGDYGIISSRYAVSTIMYNALLLRYKHYSDPTGSNNMYVDPMFFNPATGDYHLQADSPCIDSGTNDVAGLPPTDFDGSPRINDGDGDGIANIDMGAIEYHPCNEVPEFKISSLSPSYIWPPDRKMKEITISGKVILPPSCSLFGAGYETDDEYGVYSQTDALAVDSSGKFALSLQVESWRDGGDIDGRSYNITLYAEDAAGIGATSLTVLVPHALENRK